MDSWARFGITGIASSSPDRSAPGSSTLSAADAAAGAPLDAPADGGTLRQPTSV